MNAAACTSHHQASPESQFFTLSMVLHAASQTDEAAIHAGNSCRLLRMASKLCAQLAPGASQRDGARVQHEAFDIAALVAASRRVPGDREQTWERCELVALAGRILNELTDCEDSLDDTGAPPRKGEPA